MDWKPLFPDGKTKTLTLSYDDAQVFDRDLVKIFNEFGMKATFHLNSGTLDTAGFIRSDEIKELYSGHEIAAHTCTHPFPGQCTPQGLMKEVLYDKAALERLVGYPVRGMAYPFGNFRRESFPSLRSAGMEYSRTVNLTYDFCWPDEFLEWNPTCHHGNRLMELLERFKNQPGWSRLPLFFVYGHSYEFDRDSNWDLIREFCREASGDASVWYATSIEIKEYISAVRGIIATVDGDVLYNPGGVTVFIEKQGTMHKINPGQTICL